MSPSRPLRIARWLARHIEKPLLARARTPLWVRLRTEPGARTILRGREVFKYRTHTVAGVPTRQREGDSEGKKGTLLLLHGGAYILLSAHTHQGLASRLAAPFGMSTVLPNYTRAPENPCPGPLEQCLAVYREITSRPGPLVIAGDSAGGGLAMALLNRILGEGIRKPDAVLAFSPWVDLTLSGASIKDNAASDPFLPASNIEYVRDMVVAGFDPAHPDASPLFGSYAGAPPILIQAIADEILLSDAKAMAAHLKVSDVPVELQILRHGIHAFQPAFGWLPEADAAVDAAIDFLRKTLDTDQTG